MCGGGGGILAPVIDPIKQTVSSFGKVFTDPGKANLGQFVSVAVPGIGGTIVSDINHPKDVAGQAVILGAAAGGAALAGAGSTAAAATPAVGSQIVGSTAPVGLNALDLPGGTLASYSSTVAGAPVISDAAAQFATGAAAPAGSSLLSTIGNAGSSVLSGVGTVAKDVAQVLIGAKGVGLLGGAAQGAGQGLSNAGSALAQNGILGEALNGISSLIGSAGLGQKSQSTPAVIQASAAGGSSWMLYAAIGIAVYLFYFKKR